MTEKVYYVRVIHQKGNNHKMTIPKDIVEKLGLKKGQYLKVQVVGKKIEVTPLEE